MIDVLIIGGGVAGLYTALCLPKELNVVVLSKQASENCNTFWAQGGIAVSRDEHDVVAHIQDTIAAGAGLCDTKAVELLCSRSMSEIRHLIECGMQFDRDESGNLLFTREAAHSTSRIVHADGDATGKHLFLFLRNANPHQLMEYSLVVKLLIREGVCYGVRVADKNGVQQNIYAKKVVIASGGVGSLYKYGTNDTSISADLHGLMIQEGGTLRDMEMMQFHPTVYHDPRFARKILLSESLRGEGATVEDDEGNRFLFSYDARGELASRDIVSQAICDYMGKTKKQVFLAFRAFNPDFFQKRFPNIYANMLSLGFSLPHDKVPISPAFHFSIGGIQSDLSSRSVDFDDLFIVGEAASNRVHGANRLASNSLLEGLVFGKIAAEEILAQGFQKQMHTCNENDEMLYMDADTEVKNRIRDIMWEHVGVRRKTTGLRAAIDTFEEMRRLRLGKMTALRLDVALAIAKSALARPESLGAHHIIQEG